MVDLKLNIEQREKVESGESVEAIQKGVITFCKDAVYLGDGQVARILIGSSSGVYDFEQKEGVIFLNIAENTSEVNALKESVTLRNVFNNWKRFATQNSGSGANLNSPEGKSQASNWTYIDAEDAIASNINSTHYMMFINNKRTAKYNIAISGTGQDGDDDVLSIVLAAFMENGKLYTLSAARSLDLNPYYSWSLILNYHGNHDEPYSSHRTLVNKSALVNAMPKRYWQEGFCKIKAERNGDRLKLITSDINTDYLSETLIEYTLPKRKPSNLSDGEYEALKKLLGYPQYIGFGNYSQNIKFNLLSLEGAIDPKVYDIQNNTVLTYDFSSKQWASAPLNLSDIPRNQILSCRSTLKMFVNDGFGIQRIA